jgi:hypothetical protein
MNEIEMSIGGFNFNDILKTLTAKLETGRTSGFAQLDAAESAVLYQKLCLLRATLKDFPLPSGLRGLEAARMLAATLGQPMRLWGTDCHMATSALRLLDDFNTRYDTPTTEGPSDA